MSSDAAENCRELKANLEGREAILVEKGASRVLVRQIQGYPAEQQVAAEVVAIPTPGLPAGMLIQHQPTLQGTPYVLSSGPMTEYSDQYWAMGYGGFSLYFEPSVVIGVVDLAASWPQDLDYYERYDQVLKLVSERRAFPLNIKQAFP